MKRLIIAAVMLAVMVGGPATAAATADATPQFVDPAPADSNTTNTSDQAGENGTAVIRIDSAATLEDARVVDGGSSIVLEISATQTRSLRIVDASQTIDGAVDINLKDVVVPAGRTISVTMPIANPSSPAVTIATRANIVGYGAQSSGLFSGAAAWADVRAAAIGGLLAGAIPGLVLAVRRLRRDSDEVKRVV